MECDFGAVTHLTGEAHGSAMFLDQALDDRQSETRSLFRRHHIVTALTEILEDACLVILRDADTRIANAELHAAIRSTEDECRHSTATWRELQGIGQQVQKHLSDRAFIGHHSRKIARNFQCERD